MNLNVQFLPGFFNQLYSPNNLLSLKSIFLHNIRSKQYKGAASGRECERTAGRQQA